MRTVPDRPLLMRKALLAALLIAAVACQRKPAETTVGSTDTLQPSTTGTTATETGAGAPVTSSTTTTTAPTTTGNSSGSGGTGTSGTTTY
jgi:hypothetical protein